MSNRVLFFGPQPLWSDIHEELVDYIKGLGKEAVVTNDPKEAGRLIVNEPGNFAMIVCYYSEASDWEVQGIVHAARQILGYKRHEVVLLYDGGGWGPEHLWGYAMPVELEHAIGGIMWPSADSS